jgi:Mn-containing catalase
MVARLLETSPVEAEKAAENGGDGGVVGVVLGGGDTQQAIVNAAMNPQHAIVTGLGAAPRDSQGNPWNAAYTIASGNLLADMRFNVTAESQGRLQVARLYQLTQDAGVRDMFSFLLARDTMHQNQWLAAEGRWASGPSMDGKGEFEYVADPEAMGPQMDELDPPVEPRLYSTPKQPMPPASS